jgi:hypothetical protein
VQELEVAKRIAATRRSLLRRRTIVFVLSLATVVMLVAAVQMAFAVTRAAELQTSGVPAGATVVAVNVRIVTRARFANGEVRVRYDIDGQTHEASVFMEDEIRAYHVDDPVHIVYDPADPSRVEIQGVPAPVRGVPVVVLVALGSVLAGMALISGRHWRLIARIVRDEPWLAVRSRLTQESWSIGLRQRAKTLVILETPNGEVTVEPVGLGRVDPTFTPQAWVAGLGARTMVLAVPGGGHVIAVRRV